MSYNGFTRFLVGYIHFFWLYNGLACYILCDITVLYNEGVI